MHAPLRLRSPHLIAMLATLCLLTALAAPAGATRAVVPDDFATIQAALDSSLADTILVRSGVYPERPTVDRPVTIVAEPGLPSGDEPSIGGLDLLADGGPGVVFEGLRFAAPVRLVRPAPENRFTACRFDSLLEGGDYDGDLRLERCGFEVGTSVYGYSAVVESCLVTGVLGVDVYWGPEVVGNVVEGTGAGIRVISGHEADVRGNVIRLGAFGIDLEAREGAHVSGNTVEDCLGAGIAIVGGDLDRTVTDNIVRRCGSGISSRGSTNLITGNVVDSCCGDGILATGRPQTIQDNRVLRCAGRGIRVSGMGLVRVLRNAVGRCGQTGVDAGNSDGVSIEGNTSYLNGGPGFMTGHADDGIEIVRNIGYANGAAFVALSNKPPVVFSCNDWYLNQGGDNGGPNDVSLDPAFIDLAADDVGLTYESPLLSVPGCSWMGALGVLDRPVEPTPPTTVFFRVVGVGPIPSSGTVRIEFELQRGAMLDVGVHDVMGRRITKLVQGALPAGRHTVRWAGDDEHGAAAPPGVYLVRCRFPGGVHTERIVLSR